MTTQLRDRCFIFWGAMDFLHILWYAFSSWRLEKLPYIDDFIATLSLTTQHGGTSIIMAGTSWALQLSIILTCILFFARAPAARVLAYAQIPLRLILATPSLSVLMIGADLLNLATASVLITVLIVSECIKFETLRRYCGPD